MKTTEKAWSYSGFSQLHLLRHPPAHHPQILLCPPSTAQALPLLWARAGQWEGSVLTETFSGARPTNNTTGSNVMLWRKSVFSVQKHPYVTPENLSECLLLSWWEESIAQW